jgi:hypothetical protein
MSDIATKLSISEIFATNKVTNFYTKTTMYILIFILIICICMVSSLNGISHNDIGTCLCAKCNTDKIEKFTTSIPYFNQVLRAELADISHSNKTSQTALVSRSTNLLTNKLEFNAIAVLFLANKRVIEPSKNPTNYVYMIYISDENQNNKIPLGPLVYENNIYILHAEMDKMYITYTNVFLSIRDTQNNQERFILYGTLKQ